MFQTQEEMAQQIAQMIISDITSVTGCDLQPAPQGQQDLSGQGQGENSDPLKQSSLLNRSLGGSTL